MEEFEEELRRILILRMNRTKLKERLLGGWNNEKEIISSPPPLCMCPVYLCNINQLPNNTNARQTKTETYTNTVVNVPIDIQYDSDQYFISGFSSEVTVFLTGSNRVTLASGYRGNS